MDTVTREPEGQQSDATAQEAESVQVPSQLEAYALFRALKAWYKEDVDHSADWRREAKEDFDFYNGRQWEPADEQRLRSSGRWPIVFNRTQAIVKAVVGTEVLSRHETTYIPRDQQPGQVRENEILSAASKYMADNCDAEDEQSEAFQHCCICGIGATEHLITYEDGEPDGDYKEERIDPLTLVWDKRARKKNIADARRMARVREFRLGEARDWLASNNIMNVADEDINASWAWGMISENERPRPYIERRERPESGIAIDDTTIVNIVHMQWFEFETFHRAVNPVSGQIHELSEQQHALAKKAIPGLRSIPQRRKVYKQAFLGGNSILGEVKDVPFRGQFSWKVITGEPDHNKGVWRGIVRLVRDPQIWANKWLVQTMHILNTTSKGGLIVEEDAFEDVQDAQKSYAQADYFTVARSGALAAGKIMPKPGQGFTQGHENLMEFAISSIRDVPGINVELLGMREANQPGVLEAQRKQAAMTILGTLFDSLRRYRKQVGRIRLVAIQDYIADGRLIRIAGQDGVMELMPLIRDKTTGKYEVVVDDAPTSPNMKQKTWGIIQQLFPIFQKYMQENPQIALTMLDYSELPSKLINQLRATLEQSQQDPTVAAQQQAQQAANAANTAHTNAKAQLDTARAQHTQTETAVTILKHGNAFAHHEQPAANLNTQNGGIAA